MGGKFPARVHPLLASEAPVAIVLRRGPANSVASMLWDRTNDSFQLGQWVRARIYERRCDISPNGRHLIYFARNSRWASETCGTWTAISRAPWLKAVVLYGKGDTWNGGGLFTSNTRYWLNGGCGHFLIRDSGEVRQDDTFRPPSGYGGECPGVYFVKLQRDGWVLKERLSAGVTSELAIFEKPLPGGWVLRKYAHSEVGAPPGRGCHWDEHELEHPASGIRMMRPPWEWADLDRDTLVWAEAGCLYRAGISNGTIGDPRLLFDFNPLTFERRTAPY